MDRLWAPWRIGFIRDKRPRACIFCSGAEQDREQFVLHRTPQALVMLNRYPYSNCHLLVAPLRHTADLDSLNDAEQLALFKSLALCRRVLQRCVAPDGYNIGVNLGKVAGAGIEEHLHLHIVPRWKGDSNFMAVTADTRVIPEALLSTYELLLPAFAADETKES